MVEGQEMGRERPHEGPLQMEKRVVTTGRARDQWGVRRVLSTPPPALSPACLPLTMPTGPTLATPASLTAGSPLGSP